MITETIYFILFEARNISNPLLFSSLLSSDLSSADPTTYADEKLLERLHGADRVSKQATLNILPLYHQCGVGISLINVL